MARTAFRDPTMLLADGEPIGEDASDYSLFDGPLPGPSSGQSADQAASIAGVSFALSDMASLIGISAAIGAGGATAAQLRQAMSESGAAGSGAGIKIGVLSDSFNNLGGAAADEGNGALPSAANVQVLKDMS